MICFCEYDDKTIVSIVRDKYNANNIKPDLSGWAQCNGRDTLPIPEKAKLDGEYVKRFNVWFDIRIIFKTFSKLLEARMKLKEKPVKLN